MTTMRAILATCLVAAAGGAAWAQGPADAGKKPPADAKPAEPKKPAAEASPMPKPPQEVADMQKKMVGAWKCKGQVMGMNGQMRDTEGTMIYSVDLDKWWIKSSLTETKTKTPYKSQSFVTFDSTSKKWSQVAIDNMGGYQVFTSDGVKDGVVTWVGNTTAMGHVAPTKIVMTMGDKSHKVDESVSMDGGKTWMQSVAVECKK